MGSRDRERVAGIVPVRIWGITCDNTPFSEHVCTVDISGSGARLRGVRAAIRKGDFIGLQYRSRQARFQVAWITSKDSRWGNDMGVQCLEPDKDIWQTDLPEPAPDLYESIEVHPRRYVSCNDERRTHTRYPVTGDVSISGFQGDSGFTGKLGDISVSGCYVQAAKPWAAGRSLLLLIKAGNAEIKAAGVVRVCYGSVAMGIEFTDLNPVDARTLHRLIEQLRAAEIPPPMLSPVANLAMTERG